MLVHYIKRFYSVKELRYRVFNTIGFLFIFRLGAYIALPGVDVSKLSRKLTGFMGLLDTFLGGTFNNVSIFSLGVMPYISASISVNLLTIILPYFQRLQKENEAGRNTLNQITKLLAIAIAFFQAFGYLFSPAISSEIIMIDKTFFIVSSMFILVAGSVFCIWLGDIITNFGIGNGVSMLIMINIVSSLPGALISEFSYRGSGHLLIILFEVILLFFITMAVVLFNQAVRKIPIQYAKQVTSNKLYNVSRQYLPIKLNLAGVMPIIFAQTIMFVPPLVAGLWKEKGDGAAFLIRIFSDYTTWQYNLIFSLLIIGFSVFYTSIAFNAVKISEDMKHNNSFIPGIQPGRQTANFIDSILAKLLMPSSVFLIIIAIMPAIAHYFGVTKEFSRFYGGTSLIIMVGVIMEIMQQFESYFIMDSYSNTFYSSSKVREVL
jgi:preprotein translocase subunit SecY